MLLRRSTSCQSVVNSSKSEDPACPTLGCIWYLKSKLFFWPGDALITTCGPSKKVSQKHTAHFFWKWTKDGSRNDVVLLLKLASKIDPWSGSSQMCVQTSRNTTLGTNFDCFFFQNASGCGRKTKHNCNSQNHVRGKLARALSMRIPFFSEPRNYSQKLPRVPSMWWTVFCASAAQRSAEQTTV